MKHYQTKLDEYNENLKTFNFDGLNIPVYNKYALKAKMEKNVIF